MYISMVGYCVAQRINNVRSNILKIVSVTTSDRSLVLQRKAIRAGSLSQPSHQGLESTEMRKMLCARYARAMRRLCAGSDGDGGILLILEKSVKKCLYPAIKMSHPEHQDQPAKWPRYWVTEINVWATEIPRMAPRFREIHISMVGYGAAPIINTAIFFKRNIS